MSPAASIVPVTVPGGMMRISVAFPPKPVSLVAPAEPNLDAHTSWLIENAPVVSSNVTGISTPTASLNGSSFCGPGPPSATPGATSVIVHVPLVLAAAPAETAARSAAANLTPSFVMVLPPRMPASGGLARLPPWDLEHVALAREVAVLHEVRSADHEGDREIALAREREPVASRAPVEHEREHAAGGGGVPAEMAVAFHGQFGGDDPHLLASRGGELHGDACRRVDRRGRWDSEHALRDDAAAGARARRLAVLARTGEGEHGAGEGEGAGGDLGLRATDDRVGGERLLKGDEVVQLRRREDCGHAVLAVHVAPAAGLEAVVERLIAGAHHVEQRVRAAVVEVGGCVPHV